MTYIAVREVVIVDADSGSTVARARGSDATGWMAMSVTDKGLNKAIRGGELFATARAALAYRILPGFLPQLYAALQRLGVE